MWRLHLRRGGELGRGLTILVAKGSPGAMIQKDLGERNAIPIGRMMQQGPAILVLIVNADAILN
jgi:hypothetical protein